MNFTKDRILIVENDPLISDFIGRQVLSSAGYQIFIASDVNAAISKAEKINPDLIITNIELPGLSGKDLMVALNSQGIDCPVIVIDQQENESEFIQTIRLGAVDFINWPAKEPEIIQSVDRAIKQVHEHRERLSLEKKLTTLNQQLQKRVRELTTIFTIGKAVTSVTDLNALFERINNVAAQVTMADVSWFLLREEKKEKQFILVSEKNLPESLAKNLRQTWDDGISSLVAASGESLNIYGDPIKRFNVKIIGNSILIVPIKIQRQLLGLLVVMRKKAIAFTESEQNLLEAVAEYASISLSNARLFRAIDARASAFEDLAKKSQKNEKISREIIESVNFNINKISQLSKQYLNDLRNDPSANLNENQQNLLNQLNEVVFSYLNIAQIIDSYPNTISGITGQQVDLVKITKFIYDKFQPIAKQANLEISITIPDQPINVACEYMQVTEIVQGLLSNAIQYCQEKGCITLQVSKSSNSQALLSVSNTGIISQTNKAVVFRKQPKQETECLRFGGIGISLELIHEIVNSNNGKIWFDQNQEHGTTFHVLLPITKSETV
jgi:DNA-binding response OmpR family regulator